MRYPERNRGDSAPSFTGAGGHPPFVGCSGDPLVSQLARFRHDTVETFIVKMLVAD